MKSPLVFANDLSIDEYLPEEEAMFSAYLDIQQDLPQEQFVLPLEQEIIDFLQDNLF